MEPLTGEVFRMPHETELWDTHVLFYRHRIFLHRHAALFLTFRWSGSVPAVRKEKRMYFDAKEFGKRLHDVRTSRELRRRSWRFDWDWQASIICLVGKTTRHFSTKSDDTEYGKVSYARFHMLFGFRPANGQESVPLVCPHCRL